MIPAVAKRGTSFKGAGLYYLHDKKLDGETSRLTTERVAWTHSRNVMADDPDFTLRVMAATAMNKDALKEAAGIRKGGRQSKGEVYSYSLAWHPDEAGKIDRSEMLRAADETIKALGAQDHQALIVCHQDQEHPHIHVILNLVNPETGKNLPLSNDFKKLEKWAHEYRKARGEETTYCVDRTKKMDAIEAKKAGQTVPFVRGKKSTPRQLHSDFAEARDAANDNDVAYVRQAQGQKDAALSQDGKRQQSRHGDEWKALSENYKSRKGEIWKRYKSESADARDAVYQQYKPTFQDLYRSHGLERRDFDEREKRLGGKIRNIKDAISHVAAVRGEDNPHIAKMVFNFIGGEGARRTWLVKKQEKEVQELKTVQREAQKDATKRSAEARHTRLKSAREDFSLDRSALIGKQRSERGDLRARWKDRNAEKRMALKSVIARAQVQQKTKEARKPENNTVAKEFDDEKPKRQHRERTPRKRGRSRSYGGFNSSGGTTGSGGSSGNSGGGNSGGGKS